MVALNETVSDNVVIARIISNNLKPHFPPAVKTFIEQQWQALLVKLAEQQGKDSQSWREAVRMLNHLFLYMDPATQQQYPNIETHLLPALLDNMKDKFAQAGMADHAVNSLIEAIQNNETMPSAETSSTANPIQTVTDDSRDDNVLAFDIKAEDLPSKETSEQVSEVDRGETVDFESFTASDKSSQQAAAEAEHTLATDSDPELDIETLEIDISEQDANEAELEQELSNLTQQLDDEIVSAEDLPPLELDLSDFEDDNAK